MSKTSVWTERERRAWLGLDDDPAGVGTGTMTREESDQRIAERVADLRERLRAFADEVSPKLADLPACRIKDILDDEVRRLCKGIATS